MMSYYLVMVEQHDYELSSYQYDLDPELIAQYPSQERNKSRLLILDGKGGNLKVELFDSLTDYLSPGSLLVVNNTRVLPARLTGMKETSGKVEFLLLTPLPLIKPEQSETGHKAYVESLLKASKRPKPGDRVLFSSEVYFVVKEIGPMGRTYGDLFWPGDLARFFVDNGHIPLPPYIQRKDEQADHLNYQTVYASDEKLGSVAAPTAGLHFTSELRERMLNQGFEWAEVTLYVGYGTFSPVRTQDIRKHKMHPEYIEVSTDASRKIRLAKEKGRKIVAVGTTTARTLESYGVPQENYADYRGWTDLFIYPGYRFKVVDQLITNFHLPGSSLMMMVSALAGRKNILKAYQKAIKERFRFFSYGDAMFIM